MESRKIEYFENLMNVKSEREAIVMYMGIRGGGRKMQHPLSFLLLQGTATPNITLTPPVSSPGMHGGG